MQDFSLIQKFLMLLQLKGSLRYLFGTTNHGLWFKKRSEFDLVGYCDVYFAGDKVERKSISRNG